MQSKKQAIIFGSNGQDGFYLLELLKSKNIGTIGVSRQNADIIGSVQDKQLVFELIKQKKPAYIFHLAADSTTRHEALWDNHDAISTGSYNILEAVYSSKSNSKVFLSGSGLQFKNDNEPIKEIDELDHSSPYVVSRNHSLYAGRYFRGLGVPVYFGFFFNHDSPRRSSRHVAQKIAQYCKNLDKQSGPLQIGNLDVIKEWTFAGDVVEAVWTLVNQDKIFECNLGSGKGFSIRDWVELCFAKVGKDWKSYVELDSTFKPEYNRLISDPSKIKSLGWKQKVDIEQLADLMMA